MGRLQKVVLGMVSRRRAGYFSVSGITDKDDTVGVGNNNYAKVNETGDKKDKKSI